MRNLSREEVKEKSLEDLEVGDEVIFKKTGRVAQIVDKAFKNKIKTIRKVKKLIIFITSLEEL